MTHWRTSTQPHPNELGAIFYSIAAIGFTLVIVGGIYLGYMAFA